MNKIAIVDIGSFSLSYDYYYIRELVKHGYKVDFFCSRTIYNGNYIMKLRKIGVNVYLFSISSSVASNYVAFNEYLKFLIILLKKRHKYRYIHFMWSSIWFLELILFFTIRNKFIFTFHNHIPHNKERYYLPYKFIFYLTKKAVFVSEYTKKKFIDIYKVNKLKKIFLFNHGVLPIDIKYQKVEENENFEKVLIYWGNVKKYKGLDFLLEIVNDVRFYDWRLEVYGKWDKSLYKLKRELDSYSNVFIKDKFLSEQELWQLMKRKCIFVLTHKKATQSGVLYTLLNYCKVFISTDAGDNGELLKKFDLKELLFKDKNSFFCSLKYGVDNYNKLKKKFCDIRENFFWEKTLNDIDKLYE